MDLEKFFLSTQKGGPSDKEVGDFRKFLIDKGKLPEGASLSELVRYVREKQEQKDISKGQVPRTKEQAEKAQLKAYGHRFRKAHGGYVKKYAKGGGVRKVRT